MFSHIFTLVSGFAGLRPNVLLRFAQKPEEFMICYVSFASNLEMPDPAAKPLVQIHVRTWVDEESLDECKGKTMSF